MGQQLNKVIKRRRRKAYLQRLKARKKAGTLIGKSSRTAKSEADKKPAKKAAVKKAKPAAKKPVEVAAAPVVETPVPAPEVTAEVPAATAEG